ncbi:alcohol dehydrogenase [Tetragenococcus halophilus subsp. flandriensis]|uniref:alcohol dehydrogenase catalytic domain-containing protein n=1 Tax=Tetragenococcus halophilus TaxID=51669 RepID=UPI0023E9F4CB|nr:alcohol dehydrogenase catalytic domain-containing protein [Tetragenococcus halophilus]GMA08742.1 alcohol dehydrogenase [Tetragenococcus halophilus subsp. flandriensis]
MKSSVFNGKEFDIVEQDIPELLEGEVLIKNSACGICGSDIGRAKNGEAQPGKVLGHEFSGKIININGSSGSFQIGDKVIGAVHAPCYTCHECLRGHTTKCEKWNKYNINPGGFSEYFKVSINLLERTFFRIPENVSLEKATLGEPIACCIRAQKLVNHNPGDNVLIIGAGTIGNIHLCLSRLKQPGKVIVTDISNEKLELSSNIGADYTINNKENNLKKKVLDLTEGFGPDIIYVCAPVPELITEAVELVRNGGAVCVFAPVYNNNVPIDSMRLINNEIKVFGTYSLDPSNLGEALVLLDQKLIPSELFLTHEFPLVNFNEAFENAQIDVGKDGNVSLKTLIKFD